MASAEVAEFGRRAGLRIQWSNPWAFESPLSHLAVVRSKRNPEVEIIMKRKNEIPDFSKKKKNSQPHSVPDTTKIPQHAPTPPVVRADKPPATSMKSGRRGS